MGAAQQESSIKVDLVQEGEWQRLVYFGPINEDAKAALAAVAGQVGPKAILDLGGVTYLNSCGIRDWSYFLKALKSGRELVLDRCADEVVRTMNMVISFHGGLTVRSVYRTYGCPDCEHEQSLRFDHGVHFAKGQPPRSPAVTCEKCGSSSEPFESDEEFFTFLG